MEKKIISIEGTIINRDSSKIKQEKYNFGFSGTLGLVTEKELEKIENQNSQWYVKEFFENKGFSDI